MAEKKARTIPRARQLMEEIRMTLSPQTDLLRAIELLAHHHLSAAPVVDQDRCLLGMLTEKDCLRILSVSAFHDPHGGRVADFLSPVSEAIQVDMDLFRVTELFLSNNFPMLPVVDRGRLVGCITRQNVLAGIMSLTRAADSEQEKIERGERQTVSRPKSISELQRVFASHSRKQLVRRLGRKS